MLISDKEFINDILANNYELGMVEQYDSCGLGVFRATGIKNVIWMSATALHAPQMSHFGINSPLSYVPG